MTPSSLAVCCRGRFLRNDISGPSSRDPISNQSTVTHCSIIDRVNIAEEFLINALTRGMPILALMKDFRCTCPHCGQHIQGDVQWRGHELQCPTCQKTLIVPQGDSVQTETSIPSAALRNEPRRPWELPPWAQVIWLVLIGALTPIIVSVAMVITGLLGPLAFVLGPALGIWVSVILTRHCRQHAPPRCFWVYPVSTLSVYGIILLLAFIPGGSKTGQHEPSLGGAQAAVAGGFVMLLILGSSVFWMVGAAIGSGRKDDQEPSLP